MTQSGHEACGIRRIGGHRVDRIVERVDNLDRRPLWRDDTEAPHQLGLFRLVIRL
jgi:hypothetical protein